MSVSYEKYFEFRGVSGAQYAGYAIPRYLQQVLPASRDARILDIGCGFGQTLAGLRALGFKSLSGIDLSPAAVAHCREEGLNVELIESLDAYASRLDRPFDFAIMTHVLEHIPKATIISTLQTIRTRFLVPGGRLFVAVPNAQSHTGAYWMYEDFTHETLFTAGSLYYVLRSAGFEGVEIVDPDGLADASPIGRVLKRVLLKYYRAKLNFWNRVTTSSFHRPSPVVFTFEVKALAGPQPR